MHAHVCAPLTDASLPDGARGWSSDVLDWIVRGGCASQLSLLVGGNSGPPGEEGHSDQTCSPVSSPLSTYSALYFFYPARR